MNAESFVDTNILLYSIDASAPVKRKISLEIILLSPIISTQVINEFINVCIRKRLQSHAEIEEIVSDIYTELNVVGIGKETVRQALNVTKRFKYSYYDALIISAAIEQGCKTLYSENLCNISKRLAP